MARFGPLEIHGTRQWVRILFHYPFYFIIFLAVILKFILVDICTRRYTSICLTKLDILDTLAEIKVCIGYRLDGKEIDYFPSSASELGAVEPIYQTVEGWRSTTEGVRALEKLPSNARKYIELIEDNLDIPGKNYFRYSEMYFLPTSLKWPHSLRAMRARNCPF